MDLKDVAAISGKPGLFSIVKPTRNGIIVETLDDKKVRSVANASNRVSVLKEVSVYTEDNDGSVALEDVFMKIYERYQENLTLEGKNSTSELMQFMEQILPNYSKEKVYPSDVKKLINWYQVLAKYAPEVLKNLGKETKKEETVAPTEEATTTEKKKTSSKKKTTETADTEAKEPTKKKTTKKKSTDTE